MENKFCMNCESEGVSPDQYCPKCRKKFETHTSKSMHAEKETYIATKRRKISIDTVRCYLLIWVNLTLGIIVILSQITLKDYLHWNRYYMNEHLWIYLLVSFQVGAICLRVYTKKCYSLLIPAVTGLLASVASCFIFEDSNPILGFNLLYVFIVAYCAVSLVSFFLFFMKPINQSKNKEEPVE